MDKMFQMVEGYLPRSGTKLRALSRGWVFLLVLHTVYYEQDLSRARTMLTKVFALMTVVDDTFDDHATLDESRKLAEAIRRFVLVSLADYITLLFL